MRVNSNSIHYFPDNRRGQNHKRKVQKAERKKKGRKKKKTID